MQSGLWARTVFRHTQLPQLSQLSQLDVLLGSGAAGPAESSMPRSRAAVSVTHPDRTLWADGVVRVGMCAMLVPPANPCCCLISPVELSAILTANCHQRHSRERGDETPPAAQGGGAQERHETSDRSREGPHHANGRQVSHHRAQQCKLPSFLPRPLGFYNIRPCI